MARSLLSSWISPISLFIVFLLLIMQGTADAFDCVDVNLSIAPCLPYLTSKDGSGIPSDSCCVGIKAVKGFSKESEDRQRICRCLEKASAMVPDINPDNVPQLPVKCGINLGFPIAIDVDCSKIQ